MKPMKPIPAGTRAGRLTATADRQIGDKRIQCRCDCGNEHSVLVKEWGRTHSCGCLRSETNTARNTTHGMSKTPEYGVWNHMRERCANPNNTDYPDYGARGITVCDRWTDFANFYADMGERPTPAHSIDRIDVNGDYEPGNCRWATPKQQANNRRPRRLRTHCRRGHEYTPENTLITSGHRYCRACKREWMRNKYRAKKAVAA